MSTHTSQMTLDEQVAWLMQGTDYGDAHLAENMARELRSRLESSQKTGKPLKVYCGYDPRTSDLHLGHTITMRKLRQFQELGHEVTFLIGNYTSLLGDPSDKDKARELLTAEDVARNAQTYAEQAFKILDKSKTRVRYNAEWLSELSFLEVIKLAQNFTVQQFMTRENFALRLEKGEPIYLHETFYALMQGYDAVAQETDVQVGGTDQLFNILTAGRKLQDAHGQRPQIGVFVKILPGTDGVIKMSKSLGNHIPILATPEDMYGKVMSIPDSAIEIYFELATRYTPAQIVEVKRKLAEGTNPRDVKMELAREIVSIFYGDDAAQRAEQQFKEVFQKKGLPEDMKEYDIKTVSSLIDVIVDAKLATSKNEVKRQVEQRAVKIDDVLVQDPYHRLQPSKRSSTLRYGKKKFLRMLGFEGAFLRELVSSLETLFPSDVTISSETLVSNSSQARLDLFIDFDLFKVFAEVKTIGGSINSDSSTVNQSKSQLMHIIDEYQKESGMSSIPVHSQLIGINLFINESGVDVVPVDVNQLINDVDIMNTLKLLESAAKSTYADLIQKEYFIR